MTTQQLIDEADSLFPNTNILLTAKLWNKDPRCALELWVQALNRHIGGRSLEEIGAAMREAAKNPNGNVIETMEAIAANS